MCTLFKTLPIHEGQLSVKTLYTNLPYSVENEKLQRTITLLSFLHPTYVLTLRCAHPNPNYMRVGRIRENVKGRVRHDTLQNGSPVGGLKVRCLVTGCRLGIVSYNQHLCFHRM